jgi:quercetin dioxygenase-like cupin family protein
MTTEEGPRPDARFGHRVIALAPTLGLGRVRMRTADLLVSVLTGEVEIVRGTGAARGLRPGQVAVIPRGEVWTASAPTGPTRLLVVAHPAGPESVLAAMCDDPPLTPQALVSLATEEGVELIL